MNLKILLKEIQHDIDLIVLSETCKTKDVSLFNLGDNLIYNEGDINQNNGVIVFVKNGINYKHTIVNIANIKAVEVYMKFNDKSIQITAM
ncbi:hypothetical protein NQ314_016061 [Rhamnusium bicolor]|uniref:Uncharacterized protein n=1 Tax=Rhamnusium bicolor TaxID=1586634 RepID=A0AAV8WX19_9CUCU|nr:hypothetical protein NQ314_016061 [Rhamnusium bicolor]